MSHYEYEIRQLEDDSKRADLGYETPDLNREVGAEMTDEHITAAYMDPDQEWV